MGYALQWIAVKGKAPAAVLKELELQGTGVFEDIPDSTITGAKLPSGWYVVIGHHMLGQFPIDQISIGCDVITCGIEEHVMYSFAEGWKDGHEVWSIHHDSSLGIEHLEATGELPAKFESIRDRLSAAQKNEGRKPEVDFICEIPIEVAKALTGFCHDEDVVGAGEDPFEVLEIKRHPKPDSVFRRILAAMGLCRLQP